MQVQKLGWRASVYGGLISLLALAGVAQAGASAPAPSFVSKDSENTVVLAIQDELVDFNHYETTVIFAGTEQSLTRQFFVPKGGGSWRTFGLKSPVDLQRSGPVPLELRVTMRGKELQLPAEVRRGILSYLEKGAPRDFVCIDAKKRAAWFHCTQFAAAVCFARVGRRCVDLDETDSPLYSVEWADDSCETLLPGDWVMWVDDTMVLSHAGIFLGHVDGESLFLSKNRDSTLVVSPLTALYKAFPEATQIFRVKQVSVRGWNAF